MATLGGDSKSDQALFALLAAQAAHEAAKTTLAAGQSGTRNSTLSRLDSLWAARRTRDSSELLQAVSEWIANEDVAAAAAWFWLTEPIQPSGAPVHVRSSRIHALFGSLRASSRGKASRIFCSPSRRFLNLTRPRWFPRCTGRSPSLNWRLTSGISSSRGGGWTWPSRANGIGVD